MGWSSWNSAQDALTCKTAGDYFARSFTMESDGAKQQVIAHRRVGSVWYVALRVQGEKTPAYRSMFTTPDDYVTALVLLTTGQWGQGFGYKQMDEMMGPSESRCPADLLDMLTPLTDAEFGQYARQWRERCRAGLAAGRRAA